MAKRGLDPYAGSQWEVPEPEIPWLGDADRRADDDIEFCDEGEWMEDDDA